MATVKVHQRWEKNTHPIVSFTADTEFSGKKKDFLSRDKNKEEMINLISAELMKRGPSRRQGMQTLR
jgi:hypothetical protein